MVDILLDEYITNTTDKSTLISVFNQTKTLIGNMGTEISVNQLNEFDENIRTFENSPGWWKIPVKTSSLIATLDLLISLLNEEFEGTNEAYTYEGWPIQYKETVI